MEFDTANVPTSKHEGHCVINLSLNRQQCLSCKTLPIFEARSSGTVITIPSISTASTLTNGEPEDGDEPPEYLFEIDEDDNELEEDDLEPDLVAIEREQTEEVPF